MHFREEKKNRITNMTQKKVEKKLKRLNSCKYQSLNDNESILRALNISFFRKNNESLV